MSREGVIKLNIPGNKVRLVIESTSEVENNNILPKGTTEMIKHKMVNEQEGWFMGTLLQENAAAQVTRRKKASGQFRFHKLLRK